MENEQVDKMLQRVMIHLSVILSTAYEFDKGLTATPKGPMYVAFMQQGHDLEYFNNLMLIGEKMDYWKCTETTLCLTEIGIAKAKKLREIETAHNT